MALDNYDLSTIGQLFMDKAELLNISTAYKRVGWFRRNIDLRSNGVARMPFDLKKGEIDIVNEKTLSQTDLDLILDLFDLIPTWATDLDLYGAAYGLFVSDKYGFTGRGWTRLHPLRVHPQYNSTGDVEFWRVASKGRSITLPANKLLYIWQPNQTSEIGPGEPIGKSALVAASILNYAGEFQSAFFQNGALTPTLVGIKGFGKLSPSQKTETRSFLQRLLGGLNKAHTIEPIDGDSTVSTLQQNVRDMALPELSKEQKETINVALGVPMSLTMSNAANYATATQDDFNFYDKTVSPLLDRVITPQLNERLFKPLGYSLQYVPTRLDAFQAVEFQKTETLNGMLDRKVITVNEYREIMGMEPLEEIETEPEVPQDKPEDGLEESKEDNLTDRLDNLEKAVKSGIPTKEAVKLVGLELPVNKETELQEEIRRWQKKAIKRYIEGSPEKALVFESDIIPETTSDKIKAALATVSTVDSVKTIFSDAMAYAPYSGAM